MEKEHKEIAQKHITHQLEEIMFHFDAMMMFVMHNECRKAAVQKKRFLEESSTYAMTASSIAKLLNTVIEPKPLTARTKPSMENFTTAWRDWEEKTVALYEEATSVIPMADKLWKTLKRGVMKELKSIKH